MTDQSLPPVENDHLYFMGLAILEAEKAFNIDEVPVGAVLVDQNSNVITASHNQPISLNDPTAHAEIMVIRSAGKKIKNYRFLNSILYVTVEPCIMCMGAIIHSRISHVVFGAEDPKWGAATSLYHFQDDKRLNHRPLVTGGICIDRCRQLMVDFFKQKRNKP